MSKFYPKIKFSVNLKLEKDYFSKRDRKIHKFLPPGMNFVLRKEFIKDKNKILDAYLENYYSDAKEFLANSVKKTEDKWRKVEKIFFKKVDKLFGGWPWPKGNYRGYVSVARNYPRYIKEKIFAFPASARLGRNPDVDLRVIAHEMLHFIEYDYLEKKFGLKPSECYSSDNTFWQFTENLNVLIENSNFWKEFGSGFERKPYDDCRKLYVKMKKIWDKDQNIDNLVVKIFKLD
jgi:hypothetical protein